MDEGDVELATNGAGQYLAYLDVVPVRVGRERWAYDQAADAQNPARTEILCHWVQVGDLVLTATDHGLIGVSYAEANGTDVAEVTIRLACSSFATVDHRDRPGLVASP